MKQVNNANVVNAMLPNTGQLGIGETAQVFSRLRFDFDAASD